MKRMRFGVMIVIFVFLCSLPLHLTAQETLVVYSYGGRWDEAVRKATADVIEKRHNCKVILVPGLGTTNIAKLVAAKDRPDVDLIYIDNAPMVQGIAAEVLEPITEKDVPNIKHVYPNARKFGDYGVAMMFGRFGITYNYEKIKDPVLSWTDLWNPKYKGHVVIPRIEYAPAVFLLLMANEIAGGNEQDVTPGFNKIKELIPNLITTANSDRHIEQLFTQSDCWICPWYDGRTADLSRRNFPVKFAKLKEGAFGMATYINLVKGSKHREIALDFINQSLEPSSQEAFANITFYGPTNVNAKLAPDIGSMVTYGKEAVETIQFVDSEMVARQRSQWLERWNKEIKK